MPDGADADAACAQVGSTGLYPYAVVGCHVGGPVDLTSEPPSG